MKRTRNVPHRRRRFPSGGERGFTVCSLVFMFLAACGPTTVTTPPASPEDPRALIAEAAAHCKDDPSEKAAEQARETFPNSPKIMPVWVSVERIRYLREHRWELFDLNHDGQMTFDEYHSYTWASLLVDAKPLTCLLTKENYLETLLDSRADPRNDWNRPASVTLAEAAWIRLNPGTRDFIVKKDLLDVDRQAFYIADKYQHHYLTPDQDF